MQVGACLGEAELRKGGEEVGRPNLPYISPTSRLDLLHVSYISLYLAYLRERGQEVG